ncbi:TIGR01777 family oxidoreductase [Caldalkalibacillus mannanilyticus]|uniref:TIGR01777 family oxidoreductase n=1 Tax=Caldalkalibacillus mannanilyticus TaxID=1418 RepID=UPI00046AD4CA|nr:TIGR01777 family oxidoreductase [Caldalkalibacillus mannanilyticus]
MKVAILGGTGFIGKYVAEVLQERGHQVVLWSRQTTKISSLSSRFTIQQWPLAKEEAVDDIDAVINLAGESINQRWTQQAKEKIRKSRIETTRQLVRYVQDGVLQPKVLINASAVGYYGFSEDLIFTEDTPGAGDFLASVTKEWEQEADQVSKHGIRVVKARLGVVLGRDEGALVEMLRPYRLFVGGTVGKGTQWVSWIHIQDVAGLLVFALEHDHISGPLNVTSPGFIQMKQFGELIGKTIGKPHWFPVPSIVLKVMLGEVSQLVLEGQRVMPTKALQAGYRFIYKDLESALSDLLKRRIS